MVLERHRPGHASPSHGSASRPAPPGPGDWVEASGKRLTHIVVTHGHGDHWFTAGVPAERFGAQVVATAGSIAQMHNNVYAREVLWDVLWPGQIPPSPVTAVAAPGNRLTLEGHDVSLVEVGHADSDDMRWLELAIVNCRSGNCRR